MARCETARHGTVRRGRLVQGGHGAAGVSVMAMNGTASIDSVLPFWGSDQRLSRQNAAPNAL
eukprot:6197031-Prymnesium_polylepis.1